MKNPPQNRLIRFAQNALLAVALAFLGACGSVNPEAPSSAKQSHYLLTLSLQPSDSQSMIEQKYGGTTVVWLEGDRAILRLSKPALAALRGQGVSLQDDNLEEDVLIPQPEGDAAGWNAWAGGWNAWAGGWNAWAGGWNAWAGGAAPPAPPAANNDIWQQIRLGQAQKISHNLGAGVKIAILDTGVDLKHPIFQGRLASATDQRDFVEGDAVPQEGSSAGRAYGHGTAVAGIIAQVAPKASLLPIRVLGADGSGLLSQIVGGIYWAADHAQVINLSLGSSQWSQTLFDALRYATQKGVYVVASAGNEGKSEGVTLPASLSWRGEFSGHVLGVGSVDNNYLLSSFSNFGSGLFLSAPGEKIVSAFPDNRVAQMTGTSFSTPLVSGALALLLSDAGNWDERSHLSDDLAAGSIQGGIQNKNRSARGTDKIGVGVLDIESALYNLGSFKPTIASGSVQTANFEDSLDGWDIANATLGSDGSHSGQKALQLSSSGKASRDFAVKPNTNYVASVWIKSNASANRPGLWIWGFDKNGKLGNSRSNSVVASSGYVKLSLAFTTGSGDTSVQIGFWSNSDVAYFDDLTLAEGGY